MIYKDLEDADFIRADLRNADRQTPTSMGFLFEGRYAEGMMMYPRLKFLVRNFP